MKKKYLITAAATIAALIFILSTYHKPTNITFAALIFLVILVFIPEQRCINVIAAKKAAKKGDTNMFELAKQFIGKECLLYTFNGSQIEGVIKELSENAVLIDNKGSIEAINLEFITRIREYPRNKKGKKKSVVLD